jgi:hypothetical protein
MQTKLAESVSTAAESPLHVYFPQIYPLRGKGRFRGYRCFHAGNWLVYYKVVDDIVHIRGLWPAGIP